MSDVAKKLHYIDDYRDIESKHNKSKKIDNKHYFDQIIKSDFSNFESSGGGGNMNGYITRPEFEEHKRHMDARFDGISKDIEISKNEVIKTITDAKESEKEKRKEDRKWFISLTAGTGVALLAIVLQLFNVI